jgi:hypothetical protein
MKLLVIKRTTDSWRYLKRAERKQWSKHPNVNDMSARDLLARGRSSRVSLDVQKTLQKIS